jgi:hypothetical protein
VGGAELIRYVGPEVDRDSGQPIGVFQFAARSIHSEHVDGEVRAELRAASRWFSENLARPRRFSHHRDGWRRRGGGAYVRTPIAISWFKPDATIHLSRIQRVVEILRKLGVTIVEIRTRNPGYVTYEDRHQVVAVPFSDQEPRHVEEG